MPMPKQDLSIESLTGEDADDATVAQTLDEASSPAPPRGPASQLRRRPTLPRKRGLYGDVKYVFTVVFGVAGARRELTEVKTKLALERDHRDDYLLQAMREMIADPTIEVPLIARAREQLTRIEEDRSRKAGAAAAAEAEIESLLRARESERGENLATIHQHEDVSKQIADKLAPLERRVAVAHKKAAKLQAALQDLDDKVAAKKASLVTVKGPKIDPAAVEADIASLLAERSDVGGEEPAIAADLDELEPKIASLKVARKDARGEIDKTNKAEAEAEIRTEEKLAAVRARKAVEDRAVLEADRARDDALRLMGEQLWIERPETLSARLRPIDEHDATIATLERRALELRELLGGVDWAAVVRGVGLMLVGVSLIATLVWLTLWR